MKKIQNSDIDEPSTRSIRRASLRHNTKRSATTRSTKAKSQQSVDTKNEAKAESGSESAHIGETTLQNDTSKSDKCTCYFLKFRPGDLPKLTQVLPKACLRWRTALMLITLGSVMAMGGFAVYSNFMTQQREPKPVKEITRKLSVLERLFASVIWSWCGHDIYEYKRPRPV